MTPIDWTLPADEILAELLTPVWVPTNAEAITALKSSHTNTPVE